MLVTHRVRHGLVRALAAGADRTDRNPVVLLPGLGAPGYLVDTLHGCAASAPTFLLDVPGFGAGPMACEPELGALVDVVTEWLSDVLDQPATLFGHSTAAQVAMTVAARRPELVGALVLAGPTFPPPLRHLGRLSVALLRDLVHESPAALPGTVPYYLRAGPRRLLRFVKSAQQDEPNGSCRSCGARPGAARPARHAEPTRMGAVARRRGGARKPGHGARRAHVPRDLRRFDVPADHGIRRTRVTLSHHAGRRPW